MLIAPVLVVSFCTRIHNAGKEYPSNVEFWIKFVLVNKGWKNTHAFGARGHEAYCVNQWMYPEASLYQFVSLGKNILPRKQTGVVLARSLTCSTEITEAGALTWCKLVVKTCQKERYLLANQAVSFVFCFGFTFHPQCYVFTDHLNITIIIKEQNVWRHCTVVTDAGSSKVAWNSDDLANNSS